MSGGAAPAFARPAKRPAKDCRERAVAAAQGRPRYRAGGDHRAERVKVSHITNGP